MNELLLEERDPAKRRKKRTTVDLPSELHSQIHLTLERGMVKSQNALIVQAVEQHLHELQDAWIDQQFMAMGKDHVYQALQLSIIDKFAGADEESWRKSEVIDDETR